MADEEHLAILRQGVMAWNVWRETSPEVQPDLVEADLSNVDLSRFNLSSVDLRKANLSGADFNEANVQEANLCDADLQFADLFETNLRKAFLSKANLGFAYLREADLSEANLHRAKLNNADLTEANLYNANLQQANLSGAFLFFTEFAGTDMQRANLMNAQFNAADLSGADVSGAFVGDTVFADMDLQSINGLDQVIHNGPSTLGLDTLYRSQGQIPEIFLRGCGVPESLIEYLPSLIGALQPIQHYSCFISYSSANEDFAQRLHERMRRAGLRVWFAPEELKGGQKLYDQIDEAIRVYDKLILVLSEASIASTWVATELRRAIAKERQRGKPMLFPIRLTDYTALQHWRLPDSTGADLAEEVRQYVIPDFTNWKDHDAFEAAFAKLLTALKATTLPSGGPP